MVVLAMLFPIVVLELRFMTPLTQWLNPVLGTFVGNAVSVWLLAWPMMPLANRALDWWLRPPSRISRWITVSAWRCSSDFTRGKSSRSNG